MMGRELYDNMSLFETFHDNQLQKLENLEKIGMELGEFEMFLEDQTNVFSKLEDSLVKERETRDLDGCLKELDVTIEETRATFEKTLAECNRLIHERNEKNVERYDRERHLGIVKNEKKKYEETLEKKRWELKTITMRLGKMYWKR